MKNLEQSKIITEFANHVAELSNVKICLHNVLPVQNNLSAELETLLDSIGNMEVRLSKLSKDIVVHKNDIEVMLDDVQSLQAAYSAYKKNRLKDERSMKE